MLADEEDIFNTSGITNIDALRDDEYAGRYGSSRSTNMTSLGNKTKEISLAPLHTPNQTRKTGRIIRSGTRMTLNRLESIR